MFEHAQHAHKPAHSRHARTHTQVKQVPFLVGTFLGTLPVIFFKASQELKYVLNRLFSRCIEACDALAIPGGLSLIREVICLLRCGLTGTHSVIG